MGSTAGGMYRTTTTHASPVKAIGILSMSDEWYREAMANPTMEIVSITSRNILLQALPIYMLQRMKK